MPLLNFQEILNMTNYQTWMNLRNGLARAKPSKLRKWSLPLVLLMLSSLGMNTANAATYKWVDRNGVVNYGEKKPSNIPESQITRIDNVGNRARPAIRRSAHATPQVQPNFAQKWSKCAI